MSQFSELELLQMEVIALRAQCEALYGAKVVELEEQQAVLVEALRSIAANSCCAPCREAGLVAKGALEHAEAISASRS